VAILNSKVSSPVNAGGFSGTGMSGNVTIPSGGFYSTAGSTGMTYTINTGAGMNGSRGNTITTAGTNTPTLHVTGEAEFDSDIKIKGVSISKTLDEINKRLAILVPDPAKLEKFEALKKAYNHYKLLEALCHENEDAK